MAMQVNVYKIIIPVCKALSQFHISVSLIHVLALVHTLAASVISSQLLSV
jgi:hypothetical protein